MLLELNRYLKLLQKEANCLERTDINGSVHNSFCAKYSLRIIFASLAGILICLLTEGFSESFVSYASTVLSILVGLFITALIFCLDKFYTPQDLQNADSRTKLWDKQAYNYTKKFTFITGYNIVLCIFTLVLLALSALFKEEMSINIFKLESLLQNITWDSVKLFFLACVMIVQRFFVLYWIFKVIYNTLFIVSSMVQYMTIKIDRKNDSN
jgi:hypothetical protein